jgi:hypothetical protein
VALTAPRKPVPLAAHFTSFDFRRRTPGPPPFSSMNSTPAASRAWRTAKSLATVIDVSLSVSSARRIVVSPTADARARSSALQRITNWAHQSLPTKNTLTAADAQIVEENFEFKLATCSEEQPSEQSKAAKPLISDSAEERNARRSQVVGAKTIRLRDKDHRRFVSLHPCLICGRTPADAHHLRFAQPRALGRKVSDEFTVPVCRTHHRELHRHGDEASWWKRLNVDPLQTALKLWQQTRLNGIALPAATKAAVQGTVDGPSIK